MIAFTFDSMFVLQMHSPCMVCLYVYVIHYPQCNQERITVAIGNNHEVPLIPFRYMFMEVLFFVTVTTNPAPTFYSIR